jgi:hypothetical protein
MRREVVVGEGPLPLKQGEVVGVAPLKQVEVAEEGQRRLWEQGEWLEPEELREQLGFLAPVGLLAPWLALEGVG